MPRMFVIGIFFAFGSATHLAFTTHEGSGGNQTVPLKSRRAGAFGSRKRIPVLSPRRIAVRERSPMLITVGRSEVSGWTGTEAPFAGSQVTALRSKRKTPAWAGARAGRRTSECGSDPAEFGPSCSQKRPATESQPSGAVRLYS